MRQSLSEAWEDVPSDPNPKTDLGYKFRPLTVIHVKEGGEKYLFLPSEEEQLHDEEFIIAEHESVHELEDCR